MPGAKSIKSSDKIVEMVRPDCETLSPRPRPRHPTVVHNHKMTTPTEDWTLYPDDVVVVKHSSIRPRKAQKVCLKSHAEESAFDVAMMQPSMPPTPPGDSPETRTRESRAYKDNRSSKQTSHHWKLRPTVEKSELPAAKLQTTQMVTSHPHRLPTPDISDVDEDGFWGCCNGGSPRT
ncbi:MAG: hypothetical protein Q9212_007075 [Teloschistes hypoglaucus]